MTSHEYAKKLRAMAEMLESLPEFSAPRYHENYIQDYGLERFCYHDNKAGFLAAVKAVGSGRKKAGGNDNELTFISLGGLLHLTVFRDAVCRVVKAAQPAVYDCEPLLSQAEEAALGE